MVISARHRWPEAAGFSISRPMGLENYTFLHFLVDVELLANGRKQHAPAGTCILYAPGTPQWFYSAVPLVHDWMHLSPECAAFLQENLVPVDTPVVLRDGAFLTFAICEIELELNISRPGRQALCQALCQAMLIRFARQAVSQKSLCRVNPETRAQLMRLRSQVFARLNEDWPVYRMAQQLHMSPSRFFAIYKAEFGVSPTEDLIRARIDAAKSMLTGSSISVSGLAQRLGYANVSHFSRQFRSRTGVSPQTYAKK